MRKLWYVRTSPDENLRKNLEESYLTFARTGKGHLTWHKEMGEARFSETCLSLGRLFGVERKLGMYWANVMLPGGYYEEHDHGKHDFVIVWFLSQGGDLVLDDCVHIKPEPGLCVMFHGYTKHKVPRNNEVRTNLVINVP